MATSRTVDGETPNGGVRSEIIFLNDNRELVDEKDATRAEVIEYDADGKTVGRTYASLGNTTPEEA